MVVPEFGFCGQYMKEAIFESLYESKDMKGLYGSLNSLSLCMLRDKQRARFELENTFSPNMPAVFRKSELLTWG